MRAHRPKVVVIMPAYNAAKTLRRTFRDIPHDLVDWTILTDDASSDDTAAIARSLPIDQVIVHERNRGYGANQKTCYDAALAAGGDIVVMLHPDHQYDPCAIPDLIQPLLDERADAVFGSRMLGARFLQGGMPLWKFYANVALTAIANISLKTYLTEIHSGFRAYTRRYLDSVNYRANSDDFVFDTEIIMQGLDKGMLIHEVPIETRYFEEASQIGFRASVRYGLHILLALAHYHAHRRGWRRDPRFV